jgi:hypothetical protein
MENLLDFKEILGNKEANGEKKGEKEYLEEVLGFLELPYKNETMIIKAYNCQLDVGGLLKKKFEDCKLFFTIDGNLLLILETSSKV